MFWADRIAREIQETRVTPGKKILIRDEKTLSGRVHIGSMRGVAIHGMVAEVLSEMGIENEFLYELNDFDPFDSIPGYLDAEKYTEHLGKPLYTVPSPEPGFANYAEYFGEEYVGVHKRAGFFPNYYRATELYQSGRMDPYIRIALEKADLVRVILKEVSNSVKDDTWLPISVVCENCGKMMTTRAYDFDGETVGYTCDKGPDGTVPCGHTGRIAPWKGASKLFWKVDWAAKWAVNAVDVEGAGKDHYTKGGSHDASKRIAEELFDFKTPFDIPYEFFLVGGKKMASSKGLGATSKEISDVFPSPQFRLMLLGKDINQQIDVDPRGESVPRLYDWYDELAEKVREGVADDMTRLYELCQLPSEQAEDAAPWQMRFSLVSFIVQMPHLSLENEAEDTKGSPLTADEKEVLAIRATYAKFWLATYAPEEYKYALQEGETSYSFTLEQITAFGMLHAYLSEGERSGEDLHSLLHGLKTEIPIQPKELFTGLYQLFMARDSGPKAGWFMAGLPREYALERLGKVKNS
jgi:lysyl-tRNA synthetase class 1